VADIRDKMFDDMNQLYNTNPEGEKCCLILSFKKARGL